mgnify:CR=1 FL=1
MTQSIKLTTDQMRMMSLFQNITGATARDCVEDEKQDRVIFVVNTGKMGLAIGKGGFNIRLASMLTGYEIDVIREGIAEEEDDVELREFSDEIEEWVIEEFEKIGLDTARSVLNQDVVDLVRRTDLEEETILEVVRILKDELDN